MNIQKAAAKTRRLMERSIVTWKYRYSDPSVSYEHCIKMCEKIEAGDVSGEKAHRWLDWVKGVAVSYGCGNLDKMKVINYES